MVRAGKGGFAIDDFRANSHVALGWDEAGRIEPDITDEELERVFEKAFPDSKPLSRQVGAAMVKRFLTEVRVGDPVVTYDSDRRTYLLGTIAGEPEWRDAPLPRVRKVQWTHQVLRDVLTTETRLGLGSIATLFRISAEASRELWSNAQPLQGSAVDPAPIKPIPQPPTELREEGLILREEVFDKAAQFIEDRIAGLDWREMQELVAGILRAMGYHATVAADGPDRGVDIFASPDGLGLQEPRIFVEVKHRGGAMGADELRAFLGGRRTGDRCLYVSTGGFTKEARYEADRSNVPLTLVTLPRLRELLLQHYERLDPEARALVPLQRLYWPVD